jgi:hypothetical protein
LKRDLGNGVEEMRKKVKIEQKSARQNILNIE